METVSNSSSDDGCSRAVLNDSAREEGIRSVGGGRITKRRRGFRGGVKSGVGGLWTFGGVLGVGDSSVSPLLRYCAGIDLSFEDCRECAGGVGGRSGRPSRFEVCFSVRGLEL